MGKPFLPSRSLTLTEKGDVPLSLLFPPSLILRSLLPKYPSFTPQLDIIQRLTLLLFSIHTITFFIFIFYFLFLQLLLIFHFTIKPLPHSSVIQQSLVSYIPGILHVAFSIIGCQINYSHGSELIRNIITHLLARKTGICWKQGRLEANNSFAGYRKVL